MSDTLEQLNDEKESLRKELDELKSKSSQVEDRLHEIEQEIQFRKSVRYLTLGELIGSVRGSHSVDDIEELCRRAGIMGDFIRAVLKLQDGYVINNRSDRWFTDEIMKVFKTLNYEEVFGK